MEEVNKLGKILIVDVFHYVAFNSNLRSNETNF